MAKNAKDRLLSFVGLGQGRRMPPPHYEAIAPGLVVTSTKAEAWFVLKTSNTDLQSEAEADSELTSVIRAVGTVLRDRDCHLKVVWGRISGAEYLEEAATFYTTGDWQRWAGDRADRIDQLGLPERYVLLGVTIDDDRQNATTAHVKDSVRDALGAGHGRISDREIAFYLGKANKVGRTLQASKLGAQPAPTELIAWMQAREQRRGDTTVPAAGTLTGANLSRITGGRVVPYTDHLRFYDRAGGISAFGRVLVLSEFPDQMDSIGDGAWLLSLANITRISEEDEHEGEEVGVIADASIRFRVLSQRDSIKRLDGARQQAKEQRKSAAKHSAGETSEEIGEAEENARDMILQVRREGVYLVEHHPRITVTASSYDELEANTEAVIAHYGDVGITATIGTDEQRDLWLETLAGDELRVPDLGHVQTDVAFFSSWFWGGSRVGDNDGPCIGFTSGSTASLVRFNPIGGGRRGDATTTAVLGRSGRGKTTHIMQGCLDAGFQGAWVTLLDFKVESAGLSHAATEYGLDSAVLRIGSEHAGSFDLFRVFSADEAPLYVARQLTLMAPKALKQIAETATLAAANRIARTPGTPTTWAVIQDLVGRQANDERALGEALADLAATPLGSVVAGEPTGQRAFSQRPGVWVLQLPGLVLPSTHTDPDNWDVSQRLSMAAMRAIMAHTMAIAGSAELRTMPKLVSIPEVHRLLKTDDGADFLDQIARMGRATGTNQQIDSQDANGISSIEGVVEQLSAVFGFQMTTPDQQDALAQLTHLAVGRETRNLIREIGFQIGDDGEVEIRKGHCIYRDWRDQAATVQIDLPSRHVQDLLSTNPDATANVVDLEEDTDEDLEELEESA